MQSGQKQLAKQPRVGFRVDYIVASQEIIAAMQTDPLFIKAKEKIFAGQITRHGKGINLEFLFRNGTLSIFSLRISIVHRNIVCFHVSPDDKQTVTMIIGEDSPEHYNDSVILQYRKKYHSPHDVYSHIKNPETLSAQPTLAPLNLSKEDLFKQSDEFRRIECINNKVVSLDLEQAHALKALTVEVRLAFLLYGLAGSGKTLLAFSELAKRAFRNSADDPALDLVYVVKGKLMVKDMKEMLEGVGIAVNKANTDPQNNLQNNVWVFTLNEALIHFAKEVSKENLLIDPQEYFKTWWEKNCKGLLVVWHNQHSKCLTQNPRGRGKGKGKSRNAQAQNSDRTGIEEIDRDMRLYNDHIYEEWELISGYLKEIPEEEDALKIISLVAERYLLLGRDESFYKDKLAREFVVFSLIYYLRDLATKKLIDPNFYTSPELIEAFTKLELLILDEAQMASRRQIVNCLGANSLILCGPDQRRNCITITNFIIQEINTFFGNDGKKHFAQLTTSKRVSIPVGKFLSTNNKARALTFRGKEERNYALTFEVDAAPDETANKVEWISKEQDAEVKKHIRNILDASFKEQQNADGSVSKLLDYVVLIANEKDRAEACAYFNTSLVFSVWDFVGVERKTIFFYKPYSVACMKEIDSLFPERALWDAKYENLPKSGLSNIHLAPFFNMFNIAASRLDKTKKGWFVVVEPRVNQFRNISPYYLEKSGVGVNFVTELEHKQPKSEAIAPAVQDKVDWQAFAKVCIAEGNFDNARSMLLRENEGNMSITAVNHFMQEQVIAALKEKDTETAARIFIHCMKKDLSIAADKKEWASLELAYASEVTKISEVQLEEVPLSTREEKRQAMLPDPKNISKQSQLQQRRAAQPTQAVVQTTEPVLSAPHRGRGRGRGRATNQASRVKTFAQYDLVDLKNFGQEQLDFYLQEYEKKRADWLENGFNKSNFDVCDIANLTLDNIQDCLINNISLVQKKLIVRLAFELRNSFQQTYVEKNGIAELPLDQVPLLTAAINPYLPIVETGALSAELLVQVMKTGIPNIILAGFAYQDKNTLQQHLTGQYFIILNIETTEVRNKKQIVVKQEIVLSPYFNFCGRLEDFLSFDKVCQWKKAYEKPSAKMIIVRNLHYRSDHYDKALKGYEQFVLFVKEQYSVLKIEERLKDLRLLTSLDPQTYNESELIPLLRSYFIKIWDTEYVEGADLSSEKVPVSSETREKFFEQLDGAVPCPRYAVRGNKNQQQYWLDIAKQEFSSWQKEYNIQGEIDKPISRAELSLQEAAGCLARNEIDKIKSLLLLQFETLHIQLQKLVISHELFSHIYPELKPYAVSCAIACMTNYRGNELLNNTLLAHLSTQYPPFLFLCAFLDKNDIIVYEFLAMGKSKSDLSVVIDPIFNLCIPYKDYVNSVNNTAVLEYVRKLGACEDLTLEEAVRMHPVQRMKHAALVEILKQKDIILQFKDHSIVKKWIHKLNYAVDLDPENYNKEELVFHLRNYYLDNLAELPLVNSLLPLSSELEEQFAATVSNDSDFDNFTDEEWRQFLQTELELSKQSIKGPEDYWLPTKPEKAVTLETVATLIEEKETAVLQNYFIFAYLMQFQNSLALRNKISKYKRQEYEVDPIIFDVALGKLFNHGCNETITNNLQFQLMQKHVPIIRVCRLIQPVLSEQGEIAEQQEEPLHECLVVSDTNKTKQFVIDRYLNLVLPLEEYHNLETNTVLREYIDLVSRTKQWQLRFVFNDDQVRDQYIPCLKFRDGQITFTLNTFKTRLADLDYKAIEAWIALKGDEDTITLSAMVRNYYSDMESSTPLSALYAKIPDIRKEQEFSYFTKDREVQEISEEDFAKFSEQDWLYFANSQIQEFKKKYAKLDYTFISDLNVKIKNMSEGYYVIQNRLFKRNLQGKSHLDDLRFFIVENYLKKIKKYLNTNRLGIAVESKNVLEKLLGNTALLKFTSAADVTMASYAFIFELMHIPNLPLVHLYHISSSHMEKQRPIVVLGRGACKVFIDLFYGRCLTSSEFHNEVINAEIYNHCFRAKKFFKPLSLESETKETFLAKDIFPSLQELADKQASYVQTLITVPMLIYYQSQIKIAVSADKYVLIKMWRQVEYKISPYKDLEKIKDKLSEELVQEIEYFEQDYEMQGFLQCAKDRKYALLISKAANLDKFILSLKILSHVILLTLPAELLEIRKSPMIQIALGLAEKKGNAQFIAILKEWVLEPLQAEKTLTQSPLPSAQNTMRLFPPVNDASTPTQQIAQTQSLSGRRK